MQIPDIYAFYLFLAFGAAALAIWAIHRQLERRRVEALREVGMRMGMPFQEEDPSLEGQGLFRLPLFGKGRSRAAQNVLRGSRGRAEVVLLDWRFTTGSGKNQSTHRQTVAAYRRTSGQLPAFTMRPETFLHRIGQKFGSSDFDFPSHPDFSRLYVLQGEDEEAVRKMFVPEVLQAFSMRDGWSVEGAGEWLIFYRARRRTTPSDLHGFLEETAQLQETFPAS